MDPERFQHGPERGFVVLLCLLSKSKQAKEEESTKDGEPSSQLDRGLEGRVTAPNERRHQSNS